MIKMKVLFPLFIVGIMVLSTFGVVLSSFTSNNIESIKYKQYKFTHDSNIWFTYKGNQRIEFITDPRELDSVYIGDIITKLVTHPKIYVSINPDNNLDVERQIFKETVSQLLKIPIIAACSKDHESCSNLPIKNCNDSVLNQVLVIKLEPG